MDMHGITIVTGQLIESEEVDPPDGAILYGSEDWESPISIALIPTEAPIPEGWTLMDYSRGIGATFGDPDDLWIRDEGGREVKVLRAVVLQNGLDLGVPEGQVLVAVVPLFGGAS